MTPEAFTDWLQGAREGASVVYYEGHLALDRWLTSETSKGLLYFRADPEVSRVGQMAWQAYRARYVHLTQQRIGEVGDGIFAYIATRTHRKVRASWSTDFGTYPATPDAIQLRYTPKGGHGRILTSVLPFNPPRL